MQKRRHEGLNAFAPARSRSAGARKDRLCRRACAVRPLVPLCLRAYPSSHSFLNHLNETMSTNTHSQHSEHHHELGWVRRYVFSTDHKVIGIRYGVTALSPLALAC